MRLRCNVFEDSATFISDTARGLRIEICNESKLNFAYLSEEDEYALYEKLKEKFGGNE